jgi:hypothetical protein
MRKPVDMSSEEAPIPNSLSKRVCGDNGELPKPVSGKRRGPGFFKKSGDGSRDARSTDRGEGALDHNPVDYGGSRSNRITGEGSRSFDKGTGGQDAYSRGRPGRRDGVDERGRGARPWQDRDTAKNDKPNPEPSLPWEPIKKLTFQAMAGLRALHANDPETFNKDALSQRYGISYDAVNRILRSNFQDRKGVEMGEKIQGTKWDMNPSTSRLSPVPAINRAFGRGRSGDGRR